MSPLVEDTDEADDAAQAASRETADASARPVDARDPQPASLHGQTRGARLRGPVLAWALAAVALGLLKAAPLTFIDPDLFHEMSLARQIVETGAVPDVDAFAYTPTHRPLVHHEWGAGLLWLGVTSAGGAPGLMVLKYLLLGALGALTALAARRRGADPLTLALCAIPAVLAAHYGFTTIRAQLLSMVALAGLLLVLGLDPRRRAPLVAWLVVVALWLNVHAGFVVGLGFMGLETLERAFRREPFLPLALATVFGAALSLASPWGLDYIEFLARGLTMARDDILEWRPLYHNVRARWVDLVVWSSMAGLAAYALKMRGLRACRGLGPLLVSLVFAMQHQRHITLLGVTWLAVVPAWLTETPLVASLRRYAEKRARLLTVVGALAVLLWAGGALLQRPFTLRLPTDLRALAEGWPTFPVGAADYLVATRFRGRLMTPMIEGSYLMWRLQPHGVRVSYDGRFEAAYAPELPARHRAFYGAAPDWAEALAAYPPDVVLVPRHMPIVRLLPAAPGWRVVYGDDLYVLVARDGVELPFVDRRGVSFAGAFP